jgi:UDP-glucose 4-epimerase
VIFKHLVARGAHVTVYNRHRCADTLPPSVTRLVGDRSACTYGVEVPAHVLIDESLPWEPVSSYSREKLACGRIFERAHEEHAR